MRNDRDALLETMLAEVNALGIYSPLQVLMTNQQGTYHIRPADKVMGVDVTIAECDEPSTVRSRMIQAAPIPDTRALLWSESNRNTPLGRLSIDVGIDPASGAEAVRVRYAYLHGESWVYLDRFIVLSGFVSPVELLNTLKQLIPDLAAEEAHRRHRDFRTDVGLDVES